MGSGLLDLPPELILKVTEEILHHLDQENREGDDEPAANYKNYHHDLIDWSCISRYVRHIVTPSIFETVICSNTHKSGSSLIALSKSTHHKHVKELHFIGRAPSIYREVNILPTVTSVFPTSVSSVLSDLRVFPNLKKLIIEFDYHIPNHDDWVETFLASMEGDIDPDMMRAGTTSAWRILMAETYAAVARNAKWGFEALDLRRFLPKSVATFSDVAFHKLLNRVERFHLSIAGDDYIGREIMRADYQYPKTVENFNDFFFNHLISVRHLTLQVPRQARMGLEGWNYPLGLKSDQMPLLESLRLKEVFIGKELIDFLCSHKETLETLLMHDCYSDAPHTGDRGTLWKTFFDLLHDAGFPNLRHFELLPDREPLPEGDDLWNLRRLQGYGDVFQDVQEAQGILSSDTSRRLFTHKVPDFDSHWSLYANVLSLQKGEDQASYDKLMDQVGVNCHRGCHEYL